MRSSDWISDVFSSSLIKTKLVIMKKLNLLVCNSLSLILSGLSCKKDEGPEPATVCGMKGDLRKNLRAQVSWSEPYNDWVLEVDNDNNGEIDAGPLFNCNGLHEELKQKDRKRTRLHSSH